MNHSYVCSAHFVSSQKNNNLIHPDYVPSLFVHVDSSTKQKRKKSERKKEFKKVNN